METDTSKSSKKKACVTCGQEYEGDVDICPFDKTKLTVLSSRLAPGTVLGDRYEIVAAVADGGMGNVYKAKHKLMHRLVAVKTLQPYLVASGSALKRFQQEAQAISAMSHPNVLTVFDFFISDDGQPYLIMDYLEGTNLEEFRKQHGPMPVERAVPIFIMACAGLSHAHDRGIIHRDIKPSNIMLVDLDGNPDFVKIIDFGIAKLAPGEDGQVSQLTATGDVFGSPQFMSPEQCRAKKLDARSDIYSLGCVLYTALTGVMPFSSNDPIECMYKQVHDVPMPMKTAAPDIDIPQAVEDLVFKAIAKEPDERYQSMVEMRRALEAISAEMGQGGGRISHSMPSAPVDGASRLESNATAGSAITAGDSGSNSSSSEPQQHHITVRLDMKSAMAGTAILGVLGTFLIGSSMLHHNVATDSKPGQSASGSAFAGINSNANTFSGTSAGSTSAGSAGASASTTAASKQGAGGTNQQPPAARAAGTGRNSQRYYQYTNGNYYAYTNDRQYAQRHYLNLPAFPHGKPDETYKQNMQLGLKEYQEHRYSQARTYFRQAHQAAETFGQSDHRFVDSLTWLGRVAYRMGNYQQAKQALDWVVFWDKQHYGANSSQVENAEKELSMIKKAMGEEDEKN